jgi:hypothetical protein
MCIVLYSLVNQMSPLGWSEVVSLTFTVYYVACCVMCVVGIRPSPLIWRVLLHRVGWYIILKLCLTDFCWYYHCYNNTTGWTTLRLLLLLLLLLLYHHHHHHHYYYYLSRIFTFTLYHEVSCPQVTIKHCPQGSSGSIILPCETNSK